MEEIELLTSVVKGGGTTAGGAAMAFIFLKYIWPQFRQNNKEDLQKLQSSCKGCLELNTQKAQIETINKRLDRMGEEIKKLNEREIELLKSFEDKIDRKFSDLRTEIKEDLRENFDFIKELINTKLENARPRN